MQFFLSQNDRLPLLTTELSDSQGVIDITSGTPVFYWKLRTYASGLNSGIGSVVGNGTSGVVMYTWTTGDAAYPGVYSAYWKVNFSGGKTMTLPNDGQKIVFEITSEL